MKFIALISSGIDSPVATYLVSKKADEILLLHADNQQFTGEKERNNFIKIAKHLKKNITCKTKTYIIPHGKSLSVYKQNCNNKFTCVFCKRMLVRYAEKLAESENADAIIMGDSLGQVASQTIQNLKVVEQAVNIPIIRPLIGFDKEEIVKIAKKIGTFDLSILPSSGCSAVPNNPSTSAKTDKILEEEKQLNIKKLVDQAIENIEKISL